MKSCFSCGREIKSPGRPGRGASCEFCRADLRVCKNCGFYNEAASNECLEPQAERVTRKESANFCDYFAFRENNNGTSPGNGATEAQQRLEALFRKG